jgi:hypothetical protein
MHAPRSRLLAFSLALVLFGALSACSEKQTPEQQIRALLDQGVKALEEKDVAAAAELLSESYQDKSGRDRQRMKGIAFVVLRRGPVRLEISDEVIEVEPGGQRAKVSAKVRALQTASEPETVGDLMPRGQAVDVEIHLVKEGDDWLVTAIEGDGVGAGFD